MLFVVTTAVPSDGGHVVTWQSGARVVPEWCQSWRESGGRVLAMLAGPLRSESPRQLSQVTALAACLDPRPPDSPAASYLPMVRPWLHPLIRDRPGTAGFT